MGIEPTPSAWKAEVLPLNYTRLNSNTSRKTLNRKFYLVEGGGFEPPKAEPADLQSDPFDRSGTPPKQAAHYRDRFHVTSTVLCAAPLNLFICELILFVPRLLNPVFADQKNGCHDFR